MTVRIKPVKDTRRIMISVPNALKQHREGIENALYTVGKIVGNRVKELIEQGPKTGRVYRIRGRVHQASAPGEPPANLSGDLVKSYNYNVHGPLQMEVGESAPYAFWLEEGTRRIKPRPHLLVAINQTQGDTVRIIYDEVDKVLDK